MKLKTVAILLGIAGYCFGASTINRKQIVEIRDAINDMLDENEFEVKSRSAAGFAGCPFHPCTAEILGCDERGLAINEDGCPLCACVKTKVNEEYKDLVPCPLHSCTTEILRCASGTLAVNAFGCELCECGEISEVEPTEEILSPCQKEQQEADKINSEVQDGKFRPECNPDGSYFPVQCYDDECFCVLEHGDEIQGTRVHVSNKESLDCTKPPPTKPIPPKPIPN